MVTRRRRRCPVVYAPPANATSVTPTTPVSVSLPDGRLSGVALTPAGGAPVPGTLSPDGRRWTASEPLAYATTYAWSGHGDRRRRRR